VKNILITFGGSDYLNQSLRIVKILQNNIDETIKLNVVVNENYRSLKKLQDLSEKNKQIILWNNVKEMGKLMKEMDLAISAGGSTVWELLYIGVPTILMIIADNQKDIAKNLSKDGYIENLGWYNKISDKEILMKIMELVNNNQKRERLFKQGQKLIDGSGKKKIAKEVIKRYKNITL